MPQQQHPLAHRDRAIVNDLLSNPPDDYKLCELARLRIRYRGFPGATDIQSDLDKVLQQWQLSEDELFQKTREIHNAKTVYRAQKTKGSEEDWS